MRASGVWKMTSAAQEDEHEAVEVVLEESDEEEVKPGLYNPKDVPLDFDGKPIPYWLFKLHGLNIRCATPRQLMG